MAGSATRGSQQNSESVKTRLAKIARVSQEIHSFSRQSQLRKSTLAETARTRVEYSPQQRKSCLGTAKGQRAESQSSRSGESLAEQHPCQGERVEGPTRHPHPRDSQQKLGRSRERVPRSQNTFHSPSRTRTMGPRKQSYHRTI